MHGNGAVHWPFALCSFGLLEETYTSVLIQAKLDADAINSKHR